jgi:hypothetical protein
VKCSGTLEGWTVAFEHGIGGDIELGASKVDKFRVKPMEGGSIELLFRVGTSDISEDEAGALFGKLGQEVMITVTAPTIASGTPAIDGTTEAFKADHPDAPGLFDGASDQHAGDFGTDGPEPGADSSDDWPEPGADSEGGETDGGAAEFEAGAAAAIAKAGVAPKRGRRPAAH